MKYGRPKTFGNHVFNRSTRGILPIKINFEEIDILPNKNKTFKENVSEKTINDNLIFLLSEYSKRNFYLKCNYYMENGKYIKTGKNHLYKKNNFLNLNECLEYIAKVFIPEKDRVRHDFYIQCSFSRRTNTKDILNDLSKEKYLYLNLMDVLEVYNYDIYKAIKCIFECHIKNIKYFLENPTEFKIYSNDLEYLKSISLDFNDYDYEKLLYHLSYYPFISNERAYPTQFLKLLKILNSNFWYYFNRPFLTLYREIIDRYSLYMNDLFKICDPEEIIKNNFKIINNHRYLFLPLEPCIEETKNNYVDIKVNDENIHISIDLRSNFDSEDILNYIHNSLLSALFFHKEITNKYFSSKEIPLFIKKIDFPNKHNARNDITNYIYGLYIWDKVFIDNDNNVSYIINILHNKVLKKRTKVSSSLERENRTYFDNTKTNIECLTLSPINRSKHNNIAVNT